MDDIWDAINKNREKITRLDERQQAMVREYEDLKKGQRAMEGKMDSIREKIDERMDEMRAEFSFFRGRAFAGSAIFFTVVNAIIVWFIKTNLGG